MKKRILVLVILLSPFISAGAQDMFPVRQLTARPERKGFPSWSPDSKLIVYQITSFNDTPGNNGLWIISIDDKKEEHLLTGIAEHPKWSPDGKNIVFDADSGKSIKIISSRGGTPGEFLPDSVVIGNGGLPCWSPDGSQIAFVERKRFSLCTFNLNTGELKNIFSEPGKLPIPGGWWTDSKSILVGLMDLKTRKSTIQRIYTDGTGKSQIPCSNENFYRHLALSPDCSLVVFAALEGKYLGLYAMAAEGGKYIPLAVSQGHCEAAVWSPDGKMIAFSNSGSLNGGILIMDVDIEKIRKDLSTLK